MPNSYKCWFLQRWRVRDPKFIGDLAVVFVVMPQEVSLKKLKTLWEKNIIFQNRALKKGLVFPYNYSRHSHGFNSEGFRNFFGHKQPSHPQLLFVLVSWKYIIFLVLKSAMKFGRVLIKVNWKRCKLYPNFKKMRRPWAVFVYTKWTLQQQLSNHPKKIDEVTKSETFISPPLTEKGHIWTD